MRGEVAPSEARAVPTALAANRAGRLSGDQRAALLVRGSLWALPAAFFGALAVLAAWQLYPSLAFVVPIVLLGGLSLPFALAARSRLSDGLSGRAECIRGSLEYRYEADVRTGKSGAHFSDDSKVPYVRSLKSEKTIRVRALGLDHPKEGHGVFFVTPTGRYLVNCLRPAPGTDFTDWLGQTREYEERSL